MLNKTIIIIFISLVILYLLTNKKGISQTDTILLISGIAALVWKFINHNNIYENQIEQFETKEGLQSVSSLIDTLQAIKQEEDINQIKNNLIMYFTIYNEISYSNGSRIWRNLLKAKKTDNGIICPNNLVFDVIPTFSRTNGISMGSNGIKGPFSNNLGISFRNPYTFLMVFKNGHLVNETSTSSGIELLKLFANSPNNNGLSLYFEPNSLSVENSIEFGKLMLQYADNPPVQLKREEANGVIPIENNVLSFLFLIRYEDSVRVLYMTETNNSVFEVAKFNVSNTDITFSNKEMLINSRKNWNSRLYTFGIYNTALSDVAISNIYQHIMTLYSKYNNPSYINMVDSYNSTLLTLQDLLKCPFNKDTCNKCNSVSLWTDITQVLYSPLKCRQAVAKYCMANPKKPMCECWDTKNEAYDTPVCVLLRDKFENDEDNLCKKIDKKDLECIKKRFMLIEKPASQRKSKKNIYDDTYTFDKIRVDYDVDGLTTEEKMRMKIPLSKPEKMRLTDFHQCKLPASATSEDLKYLKQEPKFQEEKMITKSDKVDINNDDSTKFLKDLETPKPSGFWTTFTRLLFG
jgi:hypothetical protein